MIKIRKRPINYTINEDDFAGNTQVQQNQQ